MAQSCMTNQINPRLLSLTSNFLSDTFIFELVFPLLSNMNTLHGHHVSVAVGQVKLELPFLLQSPKANYRNVWLARTWSFIITTFLTLKHHISSDAGYLQVMYLCKCLFHIY